MRILSFSNIALLFYACYFFYIFLNPHQRIWLSRLFLAQMALASLVAISGPKKSRFSRTTHPMSRVMDVTCLKTIKYKLHIKNRYIGNLMYINTNEPVFLWRLDLMILGRAINIHYLGHWKGRALKSRLFWAQMALAALVAISGPKKVSISGPTPYDGPCNGCSSHQNHSVPRHKNNR